MKPLRESQPRAGARLARAGTAFLLLAPMLAGSGCIPWMDRTERKLDETVQETRVLRSQQNALAGEVAQIRRLLEGEGLVDDEHRAELLTRLRDLERAVTQLNARNQEQEDLLRRVSASLDQLTRQTRPFEAAPSEVAPEQPAPVQTPAPTQSAVPAPTQSAAQAPMQNAAPAPTDTVTAALDSLPPARVATSPDTLAPAPSAQDATATDSTAMTAPAVASPDSGAPDTLAAVPTGADTLVFDDEGGSPELVVYDAARGDFARGNYGLAEQGFLELLGRFPGSQLADNAGYWLGESLYAEGHFDEALMRFQEVLSRYPGGDALPAALLKSGYCLLELGDTDGAIAAFKRVTLHYPDSDEAANAQHRLTAMGNRP